MNLINEKALNDFPRQIFIGETKIILHQMKKILYLDYLIRMKPKVQDFFVNYLY